MRPWLALLLLLLAPTSGRAQEPGAAADPGAELQFTAGIFESYAHQQQNVAAVFNDQASTRVTQSSQAKRLVFGWRWQERLGLLAGFDFPVRDESLRSHDVEVSHYHFPKALWAGLEGRLLRVPMSPRASFELSATAGVRQGLAANLLANLWPTAEADLRIAVATGSLLQVGFEYVGVVTSGSWAMVLGVAQRF